MMHKHYIKGDVVSLGKNVQAACKEYEIPYAEEKIKEAQESGEERFFTKEDVQKIVDDVVTNNLARRRSEGKMTGEWIVYFQHKNQKFYLCLAKHDESDEKILQRIKRTCVSEFPFLQEVL